MPAMDASVIICGGCARKFAWKPELAGRRVKCKCGEKISVAAEPAATREGKPQKSASGKPSAVVPKKSKAEVPSDPADLDGLMALADDADRAAAAMPIEVMDIAPVAHIPIAATNAKSARQTTGRPIPLGYHRGATAADRQRAQQLASALIDPVRDLYAPIGFLVVGLLLYFSYFIVRFHLPGAAIVPVGFGVLIVVALKTALLVGFALVVSGPLGVGFGSLWTAILKLAAIAVFTDGVIGWVDIGVGRLSGGVGSGGLIGWGMIGWPLAIGLYWGLLIYLFGMDPGDSRMVVALLAIVDRVVRLLVTILLLETILNWGGVSVPSMAGIAGSGTTTASRSHALHASHASALATRVDELKESGSLMEAKKYIADGHQAVLSTPVNDWYANGCPNVWFEMRTTDMLNHKRSASCVIVELPATKARRAKCFEILKDYYKSAQIEVDPSEFTDNGDDYLQVEMR
jgi:hypothetical protein